jgi:hypothetical protein
MKNRVEGKTNKNEHKNEVELLFIKTEEPTMRKKKKRATFHCDRDMLKRDVQMSVLDFWDLPCGLSDAFLLGEYKDGPVVSIADPSGSTSGEVSWGAPMGVEPLKL